MPQCHTFNFQHFIYFFYLFLDYCTLAFFEPRLAAVRHLVGQEADFHIGTLVGLESGTLRIIYIVYTLQTIEILLAVDGQNSAPGGIYETLNIMRETILPTGGVRTCPSTVSSHINPPGRVVAN